MGRMGHGSRAQWVTWVMGHSEWPIPCSDRQTWRSCWKITLQVHQWRTDACRCGNPVPKFTKFGQLVSNSQTPNTAKFRRAPTKICEISLWKKILLSGKVARSSPLPDLSPIDRPYTSFYRHSVVTLALDCFVSEISLVLYRKWHFCRYPLVFLPKFGDVP